MKSNQHGFLMVELTAYTALYIMLGVCVTAWFLHSYRSYELLLTTMHEEVERGVVLDFFVRDVLQAPADQEQWVVQEPTRLIWKTQEAVVGWYTDPKGHLVRSTGSYDALSSTWSSFSAAVVSFSMKARFFLVKTEREVKAVKVSIGKSSEEFVVPLCAGAVE